MEYFETPWYNTKQPIVKKLVSIQWQEIRGKKIIKHSCSMPCLELAGISRNIGEI